MPSEPAGRSVPAEGTGWGRGDSPHPQGAWGGAWESRPLTVWVMRPGGRGVCPRWVQSRGRSLPEATEDTDLSWGGWAAQGSLRVSVPGAPGHGTAWTTAGSAGPPNPAWHPQPELAPALGCEPGGRPRPVEPAGPQPQPRPAAASWGRCEARPGRCARPPGSGRDAPPAAASGPLLRPPPPPVSAAALGPVGGT